MMLSITNAVYKTMKNQFESLILNGDFPKINFHNSGGFRSYNMIEYNVTWATFVKVIDNRIKEQKLDEELGVFTRKRSKDFIEKLGAICQNVSGNDVKNQPDRFGTMFD